MRACTGIFAPDIKESGRRTAPHETRIARLRLRFCAIICLYYTKFFAFVNTFAESFGGIGATFEPPFRFFAIREQSGKADAEQSE